MAGKSPVTATSEQMAGVGSKACGPGRAEADRARAVLLTLRGWTSARIAEAFGVREDTVRLWRGQFLTDGVEALETKPLPGPAAVEDESSFARRRASVVGAGDESGQLDACASGRRDRRPRGRDDLEIAAFQGAAQKGGFRYRRPRHTLKGRQDAEAVDRGGLRIKLLRAQAEAGDIELLFADESEALTHPYLARAWARRGADLRVPAPGQSQKIAMIGSLD